MYKDVENLTNKEIGLLEEMKKNCLGNEYQVYKDKKAKDKFYLLCHLEDFCIKCYDLQQENKQLKLNHKQLSDINKMAICNSRLIQENKQLKKKLDKIEEVVSKPWYISDLELAGYIKRIIDGNDENE